MIEKWNFMVVEDELKLEFGLIKVYEDLMKKKVDIIRMFDVDVMDRLGIVKEKKE